jgi:hypothetical protein
MIGFKQIEFFDHTGTLTGVTQQRRDAGRPCVIADPQQVRNLRDGAGLSWRAVARRPLRSASVARKSGGIIEWAARVIYRNLSSERRAPQPMFAIRPCGLPTRATRWTRSEAQLWLPSPDAHW